MALVKGTNSYVDVAEANTYFADSVLNDGWIDFDDSQRSQALVTATSILDDQPWVGVAAEATQPLAFPRMGTYYDQRVGRTLRLLNTSTEAPDRVKEATYELANHILENDGVLVSSGSVNSLSASGVELMDIETAPVIPSRIRRMYAPLIRQGRGYRQVFIGA